MGWSPNRRLAPGDGCFFSTFITNQPLLLFTGTRRASPAPYPLVVGYQIVSHQLPVEADYEETGLPEVEGARVLQWTNLNGFTLTAPQSPGWKTSAFTNGMWEPSLPSFAIGEAFFLYLSTTNVPPRDARVRGFVKAAGAAGASVGPLAGVTVAMAGQGSTLTDVNGRYEFTNVTPGNLTIAVTKPGYLSRPAVVALAPGERRTVNFEMIAQSASGLPSAYDFRSDNRFFISGTPGGVNLSVVVVWNGSPGSVTMLGGGGTLPAIVTDLGNGQSEVTIALASVPTVSSCSELNAEIVNGQGARRTIRLGAFFDKKPSLVGNWFGQTIPWQLVAKKYKYDYQTNWVVFSNAVPSVGYSVEATVGIFAGLKLDPRGGTFDGKLGGFGKLKQKFTVNGVKTTGEAKLTGQATLEARLPGCAAPMITPGWSVTLAGKAGLEVPVVTVVDTLLPPAKPFIEGARKVPALGAVVDAAKLELYVLVDGSVVGKYQNFQGGTCFLGTTSLDTAASFGLELAVKIEAGGAKARAYGRGTVRPMFSFCPDVRFLGTTLEGTLGFEASAWVFEYKKSATWTITLGGPAAAPAPPGFLPAGEFPDLEWQPIGTSYLIWGEANHLLSLPVDDTVIENVTTVAAPAIFADATETLVLYSRSDTNKPWHAAADIGRLRQLPAAPYTAGQVTDDLASEFNPRLIGDASSVLAAWERVSGDISTATNPAQIPPHLEIAAGWYDRASTTWSAPAALTANSLVDRQPQPVAFGAARGIVWIQNAGAAEMGHSMSGDRLLYSAWTGTSWAAPQILWSAPKGILNLSFVADASGQGHVVFAVDDDGAIATRADRELYRVSSSSGLWQPAVRLTSDMVEDSMPVLVAPNGVPRCAWSTDGVLVHSALGLWNPQPVYVQAAVADQAATLAGTTIPGGAAIAYSAGTEEGSDIFASFYDASMDRWSLPRRLTHDEHFESSLSLAFDGTELVLTYLKTATLRTVEGMPESGRTDLSLLRYTMGKDLAVVPGSLSLNPPNPAPGSSATLSAVIENRGDLPVSGAQVVFYDGNPSMGGTPIGSPQPLSPAFIAGTTQEVSVTWAVPPVKVAHSIYVVADPTMAVAERDRSNNTNLTRAVLPDLTIETCWSTELSPSSVALMARIVNTGVLASAPGVVSWRLGAMDGEELGRSPLVAVPTGPAEEVSFRWDYAGRHFTGDFVTVYAVADGTNAVEEFDETNNDCAQSVRVVPPWVPRLLSVEIRPGGNRKLTFTASHFTASEMSVERANSLSTPFQWNAVPGAAITEVGAGMFEVEVPPSGGSAFYRIQVVP